MNNKYAKLINNRLLFPPKNNYKLGILNYDLNIDLLIADGYKPFIAVERPETNRFYHIEYEETIDDITEVIVYDETQEEADEREAAAEAERIGNLTMTALDFIKVLENTGLDYVTQIKPFLEANPELDKQLKYCQNVWCGVAKQVFNNPLTIGNVTITAEMVEQAFKVKNGEV